MHPPHSRRHAPDFLEDRQLSRPMKNHISMRRGPGEGFRCFSDGDGRGIGQRFEHRQLRLGRVGQNQNCDIVHEEKNVPCSTSRWKSYVWSKRRPSPRRAPWVWATRTLRTRRRSNACGGAWRQSRSRERSSLAKASATRPPCCTSARKWDRRRTSPAHSTWTSLLIRSRARISALLERAAPSRCW